jgi:hypothetical protein
VSDDVEILAVDTDGDDTWWIAGHHDDVTALDAVRRSFDKDWQREFPQPFAVDYFTITRGWWRDAHDPTDDERWEKCKQDDEGALPFTVLAL